MSLFKIPSPKPRLARNGFDLSSRRIFSAKAGQLLPVGCWEVNPSEHFKISVQDIVRTTTVNTAAYARMKEYYHFFFVSYKSLWQWFDQFIVGTPNPNSALNGINLKSSTNPDYTAICNSVPSFKLSDLLSHLKSMGNDSQGFSYSDGAFKLLNMLGYGNSSHGGFKGYQFLSSGYATTLSNGPAQSDVNGKLLVDFPCSVSPFRLLAYQKIFNDFYRVQDWSPADVRSFNIDDFANNTNLTISKEVAATFCQMRYRPYSKDWLTSMKPTPNYDKGIFNLPDYVGKSSDLGVHRSNDGKPVELSRSSSSELHISVADLRAAFALDKMLEATRRANGYDYSSQIEAHFGFKVPESRAGDARFLGGFDNSIAISEVTSTSDSTNDGGAALGALAGKGIGMLNSGSISFDAKEHGLIMCIYSVAPQSEYNASYLDPFNRKLKREEFFQPEFADLGYQPVLSSDLMMSVRDPGYDPSSAEVAAGYPVTTADANNRLLGWQVRYNEYKTARDLVFGEFESGQSLSYWCTPRFDFGFDGKSVGKDAVRSPWSPAHFYINPGLLNSIFTVSANLADHFMVNSFFDVKAVRPMSVSGLSNL